ncbi:adenylate/guanylate cyclase domain-containing protein [Amycolatopsis aidingensis]|uniref:adenylate/guanylate cyclase domain-containing protein n=1 Tax=Amycolatopsis aidingensis TaxID=2842453 RepID=UPI001C0E6507|nr:adenylate/guanylate cyclase domain-containing protein [Amycolatopsis aidingensis]
MSTERGPRVARPFGSFLLGGADQHDTLLRLRVRVLLTGSLVLANLIGAVVVVALITLVLPGPSVFTADLAVVNFVVVPAYVLVAVVIGVLWGTLRAVRVLRWAFEDQDPDERDRRATLRVPLRLFGIQAVLWLVGTALFTTIYAIELPDAAFKVAFTAGFGGLVVCANAYLLSEFALRPLAARALSRGPAPRRRMVSGVTVRMLMAWGLGSGVPVTGLMIAAVFALVRGDVPTTQLAITILALGAVILVFGCLIVVFMARATVAPIRTVRAALQRVQRGDLSAGVVVFDGTELGLLQSGFNRMVDGLRERELIRDLFGRHVGHEVARDALSRRIELGGEVREVAVLFVDVIGSTTLAANRPPAEVVDVLNRFFAVVVAEVHAHGGSVNKFEGDAALAVFGAPHDLPDPAGSALAAARVLSSRLAAEITECQAGIGVAAGPAVAGNVGAESRFEYTVIGDPVNEAARLTELAKSVPGRAIASMRAVRSAAEDEAARWTATDETTLRGRTEPTLLAVPTP